MTNLKSRGSPRWGDTLVLGFVSSQIYIFTTITTTSDSNTLRCEGWVIIVGVCTTYNFGSRWSDTTVLRCSSKSYILAGITSSGINTLRRVGGDGGRVYTT